MNFYIQRQMYPTIAAVLNNILRRKMCNSSKYSNHLLFRKEHLLAKKPRTLNEKFVPMTFYSSGSNSAQEVNRIMETLDQDGGKPTAPDPETCCETGCVNCVWIRYVEELENYYPHGIHEEEVKDILKQIHDPLVRSFVKMELGA